MEATVRVSHDPTRYQGKHLLRILLAFFGPAFVLFLTLVLGIAERANGVNARQALRLNRVSYVLLGIFWVVEIFCARYLQRLLPRPRTRLIDTSQYAGVMLLCLFTSYCGAVTCEAFGYEVLLRLMWPR